MPNPYGDLELDAQGIRALAHPVRLQILYRLQQHGPATATALAPEVGASPSVTSWHLRHLAKHGLVRDSAQQGSGRERWWEAPRGIQFNGDDPVSQAAQRRLRAVMEQVEGDLVGQWTAETEPELEVEWRAVSGRSNTTVLVTREELIAVERQIEELLAPYVLRKDAAAGQVPTGAREVRLIRHILPSTGERAGSGD